jgi:BirA family biotin operon repressor/biotin-[acetyl-CoA-carboxylase] ligase
MSLADAPAVRSALAVSATFGPLEHHERVGSTNDVARIRLAGGAEPGLVVVADRQTTGRGRAGRSWTDDLDGPEGPANLAVTATVAAPERDAELTSLATGLAVADAFAATAGDAVAIGLKWPNDVLLGGRKAAGILVERHAVGGRDVLLIGCGLDLDWRGVERRDETATWTSLAEVTGGPVDRVEVLAALLTALTHHLGVLADDPQGLLMRYRERCVTIGQDVDVRSPRDRILSGTAVAVDDRGHLVVDTGRERVEVLVGDVTHVRPAVGG